jgi:hypothetical protein
MSRAVIVLAGQAERNKAHAWINKAPVNARVEFKAPKRSLPQNDRLWLLLTAVAEQATWAGKKRATLEWKDLFTGAVKIAGGGVEAVPGLEGGLMLLGLHTSDMSKAEMVELQDYIETWCVQNDVTIPPREPTAKVAA